jgi:hypothetical protein
MGALIGAELGDALGRGVFALGDVLGDLLGFSMGELLGLALADELGVSVG